jgi:hypothetical protein
MPAALTAFTVAKHAVYPEGYEFSVLVILWLSQVVPLAFR